MLNDTVEKSMITTKIWHAFQRRVFGNNKTKCAKASCKLSSDDIPLLITEQIQVTGFINHHKIRIKSRPNSSRIVSKNHSQDSMLDVRHQRIQL